MTEQELRQALRDHRAEPPQGFDVRSDMMLARLTERGEVKVKKVSGLMIAMAVMLVLTLATAVAAGIVGWRRGLEERLGVTEEVREAYGDSALFDEPGLRAEQDGVAVTLDECIVDSGVAYMAFRVHGWQPRLAGGEGESRVPQFDGLQVEMDGMEELTFIEGLFFDGLDSEGRLADGSRPQNGDVLPYVNEDGDLVYIVRLFSNQEDFAFAGRKIRVTLRDLGVSSSWYQRALVDAEGPWVFDWTLRGDTRQRTLEGLDAPLGDTGAVLESARLSPVSVSLCLRGEGAVPWFCGFRLKDGTVLETLAERGYADEEAADGLYRQKWMLSRIVDPAQVQSLLLALPEEGAALIEIELP